MGLFFAIAYQLCVHVMVRDAVRLDGEACSNGLTCLASAVVYLARLFCLFLAPLANDVCITRLVIVIETTCGICTLIQEEPLWVAEEMKVHDHLNRYATYVGKALFVFGMLNALRMTEPVRMQRTAWDTLFVFLLFMLVSMVALVIRSTQRCGVTGFLAFIWVLPVLMMILYLARRQSLRQSVQASIGRLLESRVATHAAAGVAGLVGNCSAKRAMTEASQRFRSVLAADITPDALRDNAPDPQFANFANPCRLGECDAFVSHSWHDEADAKWEALQAWRASFVAQNGREPRIWLDKYCVDQNNIDDDLRCLPIFLSGCKRMVVLCGPTYLTRLWCIVELFAFVHMDRRIDEIEFVPVLRDDPEAEDDDRQVIDDTFGGFDAAECGCFSDEDKQRMLSIICAAFGDLNSFNEVLQCIFAKAQWREKHVKCEHSLPRSSSSTSEDDQP
uniref:TIR domain-containing protein n=1 Tax=Zooxanthella nutricula TaxID=1333877 RepID=A0A7S2HSR9_9DINO